MSFHEPLFPSFAKEPYREEANFSGTSCSGSAVAYLIRGDISYRRGAALDRIRASLAALTRMSAA